MLVIYLLLFCTKKKKGMIHISKSSLNNYIKEKLSENSDYYTLKGKNNNYYTHKYHRYPATMIPSLVDQLLNDYLNFYPQTTNIYDPFMGSGTTLIEGLVHGLDVVGMDVNPLSYLMSKVKTNPINPDLLNDSITQLFNQINVDVENNRYLFDENVIPHYKSLNHWFKLDVIEKLAYLKTIIVNIEYEPFKLFLLVAFSNTLTYCSNCRNSEFKLYRMNAQKLENWNPNVIEVFVKTVKKNQLGNNELFCNLEKLKTKPRLTIYQQSNVLMDDVSDDTFDLCLTSPPYGDSRTTASYGQFSRLSSEWLNLEISEDINLSQLDNVMLGGYVNKKMDDLKQLNLLQSDTLIQTYNKIKNMDRKRAMEVLQFFCRFGSNIERNI